jgi:hypothetical protein
LKIAYCIIVHKNPEQVSRLISRIYDPSDYFFIHKDKSKPSHGWESLQKYPKENVLFTSKYNLGGGYLSRGGYPGGFEFLQATLDAMNWCHSFDYDYFINLSGQCYPITRLAEIKGTLQKTNAAYMEYFRLPANIDWGANGGLDRLNYFYIRVWNRSIRLRWPKRALPYSLKPYGGSLYSCLPKRFVDYILDYLATHPKILRFYRYSNIPAEMFLQTIIMNSSLGVDVVNDHKRYFHWEGTHPSILRKADFEHMVQSEKWFAKTFDMNIDKDVLDLLDNFVHGHSS